MAKSIRFRIGRWCGWASLGFAAILSLIGFVWILDPANSPRVQMTIALATFFPAVAIVLLGQVLRLVLTAR
ncbi:MAG: hypothetical protein U1E46_08795 [Hyphomicrobiales bacterium]